MKLVSYLIKRLRTISIIEMFVVLVIAGITIGSIRYLFTNNSDDWRYVYLQVDSDSKDSTDILGSASHWLANQIKVGDAYYSSNGALYAEVVAVDNYDIDPAQLSTFVTLKLRGVYRPKEERFLYESRRVAIGEQLTVYLVDKQITGTVLEIGSSLDEVAPVRKTVDVTLRLKLMDSWLVQPFTEHIPFDVIDLNTSESILHIDNYSVEISDYDTYSVFVAGDMRSTAATLKNDYRDLILHGQIVLGSHFGQWYFAGNQLVKIGSTIEFSTPTISKVYARVQDVSLPTE